MLNLVIGESAIGEALVEHPDIAAISFTGSTAVGRRIAASAAARGVPVPGRDGRKERGHGPRRRGYRACPGPGDAGSIPLHWPKCTATSRLIVTEGIADRFLDELATRVDALVVGDPTDEATQMGPVITGAAQRNIYGAWAPP